MVRAVRLWGTAMTPRPEFAFIDSGGRAGLALFSGAGRLVEVWAPKDAVEWLAIAADVGTVPTVVFEKPVIRPGGRARPNDLITLACRGAYFAGLFRPERVVAVLPEQWKAQAPKAVVHERILGGPTRPCALTVEELAVVDEAGARKSKDALDAIGIGLAWFRRLPGQPALSLSNLAPGV